MVKSLQENRYAAYKSMTDAIRKKIKTLETDLNNLIISYQKSNMLAAVISAYSLEIPDDIYNDCESSIEEEETYEKYIKEKALIETTIKQYVDFLRHMEEYLRGSL